MKRVYLDALIESYIAVLGRLDDATGESDSWLAVYNEIKRLRKLQTDAGHADYYERRAA